MKLLLLPCVATLFVSAQSPTTPQQPQADRAELEAKFEQLMSGCTLVGHFTDSAAKESQHEERYTISKASKVRGDKWRFDAKIEYGGKSVTVPVIVPVHWAGDTPVISVTDMQLPMLGTYTARVMIYADQYAGMWSGKTHGGLMYGTIERAEPTAEEKAKSDKDGGGKDDGGKDDEGKGNGGDGKAAAQDGEVWWGSWRGPNGNGVATSGNPPAEWSEDKNIRWKVAVPGLGISSPIVWKDRIYLTTAVETDRDGEPAAGAEPEGNPPEGRGDGEGEGQRGDQRGRGGRGRRGGRRGFGGAPPTKIHEFKVLALDRNDGSVVWETEVIEQVPHERGHNTATQASNSPLTDGEHIIAFFGSRGLYCLDMEGKVQWSKNFGPMRTSNAFGEGASPALYGDVLVMTWDHEGDSFIAAFDKSTGDELWRRDRDERTTWATPVVIPVDGTPQVIATASGASRAYDLMTGEDVWSCKGLTSNCIPTPNYQDGMVYLMSGFRGYKLQAIKLAGATGDITASDSVVWSHGSGTSYVPSSLLHGDNIYFLSDSNGILSCLDAKTGDAHYTRQRLGDVGAVYASPVAAGGKIYVTGRDGSTKVIKAGDEYEEIATNQLDDGFDASMAIVGDEIYLRGRKSLYCIAEQGQ